VDLGAQWVHGQSGNIVFELASKHDLLDSSAILLDPSKNEFVTFNGEIISNEESSKALVIYYKHILNKMKQEEFKEEEGSYGDYFTRE